MDGETVRYCVDAVCMCAVIVDAVCMCAIIVVVIFAASR